MSIACVNHPHVGAHAFDAPHRASVRRLVSASASLAAALLVLPMLSGCATIGSAMSPYSEKFSCKNSDHGQCIHPEDAYNQAVAGLPARSDPRVTNDPKILKKQRRADHAAMLGGTAPLVAGLPAPPAAVYPVPAGSVPTAPPRRGHGRQQQPTIVQVTATSDPYASYRDGVYREMQGLVEAPVTPMLKPPQTIRTLIMPYSERQRPDRLYMPRYVYSVVDRPIWVVGDYLVDPVNDGSDQPVLAQFKTEQVAGPDK